MNAIVGGTLIALGTLALLYQGVTYKSRDTVLDIGPLHATAERQHTVLFSPVVGIAAIAGGIVVLIIGATRRPV